MGVVGVFSAEVHPVGEDHGLPGEEACQQPKQEILPAVHWIAVPVDPGLKSIGSGVGVGLG